MDVASSSVPACDSCGGTGEYPTENGVVDCPDCGGAGYLPSRQTLVEWRARDIERAFQSGVRVAGADVQWLIAELRSTRDTLRKIVALAHDAADDTTVATQIRRQASHALGEDVKPVD